MDGDFVEVFNKAKAGTLPPHQSTAIDLEPGNILPYLTGGQLSCVHAIAWIIITCS